MKAFSGTRTAGAATSRALPFARRGASGLVFLAALTFGLSAARGELKQEDVFRSIQENVREQKDSNGSKPLILLACTGGGALLLLVLFSQRRQRRVAPRALHHHGKLVKEVMRKTHLRPVELRQLRVLTEAAGAAGADPVASPLTLLLCPSLLDKGLKARPGRVDRKVVAQIVRKLNAR